MPPGWDRGPDPLTIAVIIPIRFVDCCQDDGTPRLLIKGRTLWDVTIEQALHCQTVKTVVVAYDDDRFLPHLAPWRDRVTALKRPAELSRAGVTTIDVVRFALKALPALGLAADKGMLLEITHPLRPKDILAQVAQVADSDEVDSVVTCRTARYNFWRSEDQGPVTRLVGPAEADHVGMYQEMVGICSVFSAAALDGDNPFGERVDIVPIDRFWSTIDVRDEDGAWLAETYLNRLGISL